MKIGINASFLRKPDSGIGQVTLNFLRSLNKLKAQNQKLKDVEFVLYLEEESETGLAEGFEKKIFLPGLYKRDDLVRKIIWEKYLLPEKVAKDGCEIFFSLYQSVSIFPPSVRHVMLVHDTVWKIFPQYLSNLRKKFYYALVDEAVKKANQIITISENSKRDIVKFFLASNQAKIDSMRVFYEDCDPIFKEEVPQEQLIQVLEKYNLANKNQKTNYIFYVGGFDVRKNVEKLIEAFGKLTQKNPSGPDLVLAGAFHPQLVPLVTDVPTVIERVSTEFGFEKSKVKQIGFVDQADLPALYRAASLFCYPSLYEGFGIPIVEAFNCGCPVLTSSGSSIEEIANGKNAIIVDPDDTDSIAEGMRKGLVDRELRNGIVQKAKEDAKRYSWENFTRNIVGLAVE